MTDVMWPPLVVPSEMTWRLIDTTALARSPTTGFLRSSSLYGSRIWQCRISVRALKGAQRAQMLAFVAAARASRRAWIPDFTYRRRGTLSAGELFVNSNFSQGAAGWIIDANDWTRSVTDQVYRVISTGTSGNGANPPGGLAYPLVQFPSFTKDTPVSVRVFISPVGEPQVSLAVYSTMNLTGETYTSVPVSGGMGTVAAIADADPGGQSVGVEIRPSIAGSGVDISYASCARCLLVDPQTNFLTRSDEFDNSAWTKTGCSITANNTASPIGSVIADTLVENTANSAHEVAQSYSSITSSSVYLTLAAAVKANGRNFCWLQMSEGSGSTAVYHYFNLSTGAVGNTGATGSNWANRRTSIVNLGNGWYYCALTARKTNSATSVTARIGAGSADGTGFYTGNGSSGIHLWRGTMSYSQFPGQLVETSSAAVTSANLVGDRIFVTGGPTNSSGILRAGDLVDIQLSGTRNHMARVIADVGTDAAGRAVLHIDPPLPKSALANGGVLVHQPMCRMVLAQDAEWTIGPDHALSMDLDFLQAVQ